MAAGDATSRAAYETFEAADYWARHDPIRFDPTIGGPVAGRLRAEVSAAQATGWETAQSASEKQIGSPRKFARADTAGAETAEQAWVERTVLALLTSLLDKGIRHP